MSDFFNNDYFVNDYFIDGYFGDEEDEDEEGIAIFRTDDRMRSIRADDDEILMIISHIVRTL